MHCIYKIREIQIKNLIPTHKIASNSSKPDSMKWLCTFYAFLVFVNPAYRLKRRSMLFIAGINFAFASHSIYMIRGIMAL
jgi:hypothetical protein